MRPPAGFISAFYDPLKNPDVPTAVAASGGDASASVSFTPPANVGGSAISSYTAISTPGSFTGSAASSPVTVSGLTNGTAYTFAVWATNTYGPSAFSASSGSVTPAAARGLFGGGFNSTYENVIDYIVISTTGNATDFGDLYSVASGVMACASSTRGVFASGLTSDTTTTNAIGYVTIASTGNTTSFGTLSQTRYGGAGLSNSTRGLFSGGNAGGRLTPDWVIVNTIDYITIATTGNATDFGDLQTNKFNNAACASPTRGVISGGFIDNADNRTNTIDYVTIATTGNALDFGDIYTGVTDGQGGCSSSTRGVFGCGRDASFANSNVISYITIASTGNSIDFGDATVARTSIGAASSELRGCFAGGNAGAGRQNVIDYITIATTGNATDFGDLTVPRLGLAGCSSGHGGL
jgi:hypothetical protein